MKKFLIPVLAVTLSLFSAFVTRPLPQLYSFTGDPASAADRVSPNNYSTAAPSGCSGTENVLCSLTAEPGTGGKPIIAHSSDLYTALQNGGDEDPNFEFPGIQGKP